MKLQPEQVGAIVGRTHAKISEKLAEEIEQELDGRAMFDVAYDRLAVAVEDALTDVLVKLDLGASPFARGRSEAV